MAEEGGLGTVTEESMEHQSHQIGTSNLIYLTKTRDVFLTGVKFIFGKSLFFTSEFPCRIQAILQILVDAAENEILSKEARPKHLQPLIFLFTLM